MKIACYCQHVLGIGHFHRSLAICTALAAEHETVMILGGPDVDLPQSQLRFFQLPGLKMDADFSGLLPCDETRGLEEIKQERQELLLDFFSTFQPDVFLVELYPFGRKAFRFELDPILKGIESETLAPCLRICSLRDILVEKKDRNTYETRVLKQLNSHFDGLLIHSDPRYIPLQQSFAAMDRISIPYHYTGFITPEQSRADGDSLRKQLGLSGKERLIVASIGGGSVGEELLKACAAAAVLLRQQTGNIHLHIFTGPYSDPGLTEELRQLGGNSVKVHDFSSSFPQWLAAADLSVSMAGYNTCMNLLAAEIPALLYPFAQNREQRMRVTAFTGTANFRLLEPEDIQAEALAEKMIQQLNCPPRSHDIRLDGAGQSARMICSPRLWSRPA